MQYSMKYFTIHDISYRVTQSWTSKETIRNVVKVEHSRPRIVFPFGFLLEGSYFVGGAVIIASKGQS